MKGGKKCGSVIILKINKKKFLNKNTKLGWSGGDRGGVQYAQITIYKILKKFTKLILNEKEEKTKGERK